MKTTPLSLLGKHNADWVASRRLAAGFGVVTILLGLLGLLSWVTGAWTITSFRPQYIPMSPSTALAFLCQGVILWLQARGRLIYRWRGAAMAVAGLVALWGLLGGVEYFLKTKTDLNLEGLLTSLGHKVGLAWPTDISPVTGVLFFLAGLGLLLLLKSVFTRGAGQLAVMLGCLVAFSGFTGLLGYLFGTPLLYGGDIIPVAAATNLAFLFLGTGVAVAAGPDFYPLSLFFGPSTRTRLTRIFLPLVLSLILAQGIVQQFFTEVFPLPPPLVAALNVLTFVIITIVAVERAGTGIGKALDRAQAALGESEERYRTLVENIDLGISVINSDYRVVMSNAAVGKLLQRPIGEFVGRECFREFEKREAVCSHCPGTKAMATGEKAVTETSGVRNDGSQVDVRIQAFPYRAPDGAIIGFIEVVEDITARKEMKEALQQSEALYRSLFENMLNGFAYCKMVFEHNQPQDFIYLKVNSSFEALTGLKDVVGKPVSEVIPGIRETDQELLETYGRVAMTGKPERFEIYVKALKMWFAISAYCPAKEYFVAVFDVITDRKQAEDELRSAAQKWQTTFDAIGDAVCLIDRDLKIIQCNQAMVNLASKPFTEIMGLSCWEALLGTSKAPEGCACVLMSKSGHRETMTMPLGDRWFHAMADPILNEAGEFVGGVYIIADITEYLRASQKIKDLNTLLSAIKDINEALLRVKDEKGLFQQTCDLLAKVPYVRFTWIGLVQVDSFEVKPAAWAGIEEGYLSTIRVTWDDSSFGQGPTGNAIRTKQPIAIDDINIDPRFLPWRAEALKRGYASSVSLPLLYGEEPLGTLTVYSGKKQAFGKEELEFLNQVAGDIAVGIKSLRLEQELIQSFIQLQVVMLQTVEAIASMAETRDPYTAGHQRGVTRLACALGEELGLDANRIEGIRVAGFLHDIGKIVVPAEILNKPGKLNDFELNIIKNHSQVGYDILKKIDFPWPVAQIVLQHHERTNGSGYPQGLAAPDILLEARILAVADVVEAMAAHRPYRPSLGLEKALDEITRNNGILYDPEVVDACLKLFTEKDFKLEA